MLLAIYAKSPHGVVVNLAAGTASNGYGGTDTLTNIQPVIGSAYDDILSDGPGGDTLTGGLGADTFVYNSGVGAVIVTDFSHTDSDKIDLTNVRAIHSLSGAITDPARLRSTGRSGHSA
jgi:Ca2+-binding RTX toxin-like protein